MEATMAAVGRLLEVGDQVEVYTRGEFHPARVLELKPYTHPDVGLGQLVVLQGEDENSRPFTVDIRRLQVRGYHAYAHAHANLGAQR